MKILGVKINNLTKAEILEKIEFFLNEPKFHHIATINPEFVLLAQKDKKFKEILNATDLNVADGVGIWYAAIRYFCWLKYRMAGVELMHEILEIANDKKLRVFLAVNKNGLSTYEDIKAAFEKKYQNIKFGGCDFEPKDYQSSATSSHFYNCRLQIAEYQVVLCNFGASAQEKFINSVKNDTIRIAMGVGGSFDFVTKKAMRAPKFLRIIGLEWAWRLVAQREIRYFFWRLRRIFNSVIIFPIRVIINR